ncbi:MAG TPA: aconitate hydratase [Longimicrobium sp.]|nr:aconitate hydratase [Longimicrobium sp.]
MADSFGARSTLRVGEREYIIYRLSAAGDVSRLPYSLRILLENLLRTEDGVTVTRDDIEALARWDPKNPPDREIAYSPARVVLQDFTGVPCVVDLAAMRDAMKELGGDPSKINPLQPVELVIDHSIQVDAFGTPEAFQQNVELDYARNRERYAFLRWGQQAFDNFKVVPPNTGIVHQVNLEYLSRVVFTTDENPNLKHEGGLPLAYPDTCVGTDSHTPMVNGLGILAWGVGGKFVEFYGPGIASLALADRATIGNMSPEYGATCAIFPPDQVTLDYLRFTGRPDERIALVEAYMKEQGLFHTADSPEPVFTDTLTLDLNTVQPSVAGPRRPQDRINLSDVKKAFREALPSLIPAGSAPKTGVKDAAATGLENRTDKDAEVWGEGSGAADAAHAASNASPASVADGIDHGSVVIAAITSCTNTSNPSVMMAAGLLAKKAVEHGLNRKPWVKTSLAPGSKVVTEYYEKAGVLPYLEQLGFNVVGYGCTTCIGNSGPLPEEIAAEIHERGLVACSVLSGNRNFEGRINSDVRANFLMSPPLVVAFAIAGRIDWDPYNEPIGQGPDGRSVFLKDIWPTNMEVHSAIQGGIESEMYRRSYAGVFEGDDRWKSMPVPEGDRFEWADDSTYVRQPTYFHGMSKEARDDVPEIRGARAVAFLGDSVTTDHISPAGSIKKDSPAGKYLVEHGVDPKDFNSYGARRGNHEVMVRGTFANVRIRNRLAPGTEGGYTTYFPEDEITTIYDAAVRYEQNGTPLIVLAGKEYGSGSSRDWAAKGPYLQGIKAVIAESYERIHRSNLVGMGVLPLQFMNGENADSLGLTGREVFDIDGLGEVIASNLKTREVTVRARPAEGEEGKAAEFRALVRIDTPQEVLYYRHGGILQFVLRQLLGGKDVAEAIPGAVPAGAVSHEAAGGDDSVEEGSQESFPASDAPTY